MLRKARKFVATFVSAALVLLSPGPQAGSAFAQTVNSGRAAGAQTGGAFGNSAPSLTLGAPALLMPTALSLAPLVPAAPAPALLAAPAPAALGAMLPAAAAKPSDSSFRYEAHRRLLRVVGALTERKVAGAADNRAVFSNFDETRADSKAAFDIRLAPDMVQAVEAVRARGKTLDEISDRPESLSSLPVAPKTRIVSEFAPERRRLRALGHEISLWIQSFKHYFIDVNIENWREYAAARGRSDAVRDGSAAVSDARGFFVDSRMLGMIGGARTVGSHSGSDAYVKAEALDIYDRYFGARGAAARSEFLAFLDRAVAYNPQRSSSNLRKHIRKALHSASLLPADRLSAHFDGLMHPEVNGAALDFQRDEQDRVVAAFRRAVADVLAGEDAAGPDRVVGVVMLGSFATGSATPTSDFDLHVLTNDGRSRRIPAFLERLEKRWSFDPDSKGHPVNGAEFGFVPSRQMLLRIHNDPYAVIAADVDMERALSPPAERYSDRARPDGPTHGERAEWALYNVILRAATKIDDARAYASGRKKALSGPPRERSLDEIAAAMAERLKAKGIKAIITDYDGTLMDKTPDDKAVVASDELVGLLRRLRELGVSVVLSTNHFFTGDHNGMTSLLGDRLDAKTRAGVIFSVQSGARVYEYGADGATPTEPAWKEVSYDDAERAKITPVFAAAAAKVGLKPGDYKIFHEDSRSLIELSNQHELDGALYAALAEANKANGFGYLVQLKPMPTMRHVPYVQYFKAHKGTGARKALEMLKAKGLIADESQVMVFGDDFKAQGNDLYMAQALPNALAVSVGKTFDAAQPNVLQAQERGSATIRALIGKLNGMLEADKSKK